MNIFYVSIETHQTYSQTNCTYTYHEEYQGMATEIRRKTDQFLQYFDFMTVIFGILILVLFVKVIIYRHKFLTKDEYDNRYITSDFVDIDNTRAAFHMDTLLPLAPREKMKYIKVSSVRLVSCERVRLMSSFVFLILATFKIIVHMLTDSSLYWILSTVRREERLLYMSTIRDEEPIITVRVVGDGLVAELFRNVTRAVKRQSTLTRLDPTPCLPDPVPPDWNRYYQIIALVIICWLLALCEPYGLRLRHTVMVTYHPDRARERAIWLYNRIISNRIRFLKASRRKLRKKFRNITLEETFRYKFMRKASSSKCLLCKTSVTCVDGHVKCATEKCVGFYCSACFANLKFCSICKSPADYGDLSDLSEEKDSSEEENECKSPRNTEHGEKRVQLKGKQREGLQLKIKKTNIRLKETGKSQKSEMSCYDGLIQPTLLCRAIQYCRSKIPAFSSLKSLSDVESSDWDYDSTIPDGNSIEDKFSDAETACRRNKGDCERKSGRRKSKTLSKLSSRRKTDPEETVSESENFDQKKRFERQKQKIGISKEMSPADLIPSRHVNVSFEKSSDEPEIPKPDFCFTVSKKDSGDSSSDSKPSCFLNTKDSTELLRNSERNAAKIFRSYDSEQLISDTTRETEILNSVLCSSCYPTIAPLKLDARYFEPSPRSQSYPFIDPANVHEFDPGEDFEEDTRSRRGRRDTGKSSNTSESSTVRVGEWSTREVRFQNYDAYDTLTDSDRVCLKQDRVTSSSDCNSQLYYQPNRSLGGYTDPANTVIGIRGETQQRNANA